jgi:hypothetical protein
MSNGEWNPVGMTTCSPFMVTLMSLAAPSRRNRLPVAGMDLVWPSWRVPVHTTVPVETSVASTQHRPVALRATVYPVDGAV